MFDPEKEIESWIVDMIDDIKMPKLESEEVDQTPIDLTFKLDILLLYLRRVHAYCLYCAEEYEDERMLSSRCGP